VGYRHDPVPYGVDVVEEIMGLVFPAGVGFLRLARTYNLSV